MKRRSLLQTGALAALTGGIIFPTLLTECSSPVNGKSNGKAKNIIFLVSDGMSIGTPVMADLLLLRKEGKGSRWMELYRKNEARRAFMDSSSADSMVTDSAAGSSAWGGGRKVNNGSLNVNPGLIKSHNVDAKFDLMQKVKYSNEWVLQGLRKTK